MISLTQDQRENRPRQQREGKPATDRSISIRKKTAEIPGCRKGDYMMKKITALLLTAMICCLAWTAGAETVRVPKAYETILNLARKGMAGDRDVLEQEEFNPAIYMDSHYGNRNVGWTLLDLDRNGTEELLIGRSAWQPEKDILWIFDIWTIKGDQAQLFARGWEQNRMYLTKESGNSYGLYFEGADSTFESIFEHGLIRDGRLTGQEAIIAFTDMNTDTVSWTLNEAEIDEERAEEMIGKWKSAICQVDMMTLE